MIVARRLLIIGLAALVLLVPAASAADRMWIGFHDDPVLRFDADRAAAFDRAAASGATIVRGLVEWQRVAPLKPAKPTDPFDPAYNFNDIDEFVRNAQLRGMEVILTLWGTPGWANGNQRPQLVPKKMADFQNFARAVASRYSGRYAGFPYVRFFGIWNESNLATFLSPQFDINGNIVSAKNYAKLAAAGYAGIKSGNASALVAIGETSSNGRDKIVPGQTDTVRPATFMKLVAKANPRLKFDAWAQHPYPFPVAQAPTQKTKYPNVTFSTLGQFEKELDTAFRRKNIPIWITEYGNETKPGEPKGVTESQQATYLSQAIALARKDPRVAMFVWFVLEDSTGNPWQSGLYRKGGVPKPAAARFAAIAPTVSMVNGKVTLKGGTRNPTLKIYLRQFCANNAIGTAVGTTSRTTLSGKLVQVDQREVPLLVDCTISLPITGLTVAKGKSYVLTVQTNTVAMGLIVRTITIVGT
ncbi:MAG: cellulase family glycosylhydrolase [Gaiellales bacterium]